MWDKSFENDIVRLAQGIVKIVEGTDKCSSYNEM